MKKFSIISGYTIYIYIYIYIYFFFFFFWGGGGGARGVVAGVGRGSGMGRWTAKRTSPNQFAPSTFWKLGA